MAAVAHPAPHRRKASLGVLTFGLIGAPAAWAAQFTIGYGLSSYACFPADAPLAAPAWAGLRGELAALSLAAACVAVVAGALSLAAWNATRHEAPGAHHELLETGEGRTRFLALCGLIVSAAFLLAILFDSFIVLGAPLCRG